MSGPPALYVLYGSQTGNAESIAKELSEQLVEKGIENVLMNLNAFKSVPSPSPDKEHLLVILCSTTGNGDCPENGDTWWRSVKLRSAAKDKFSRCKFLVLGLGDSNYDKFCFMGKSIDKRLGELGGTRVQPLTCVDETTGLEEAVEKWKSSTLSFLSEIYLAAREETGECKDSTAALEDSCSPKSEDDPACLRKRFSKMMSEKVCAAEDVLDNLQNLMPEHIQPVKHFIQLHGLQEKIDAVEIEELSGKEARKPVQAEVQVLQGDEDIELRGGGGAGGVVEAKGAAGGEEGHGEFTATHPFTAPVHTAKWLTNPDLSQASLCEGITEDGRVWGDSKRVVYCEVNISDMHTAYHPGDSIGVCTPNPPYCVNVLLKRLRQAHEERAINADTKILLPQLSCVKSLGEVLTYHYDLTGMPKKSAVKALAKYCLDDADKRCLLALVHKDFKGLWTDFVEKQGLGIAELIYLFKSCLPTIPQLCSVLCPAVPRYYSIASSPLATPNRIGFAFSTVRYVCQVPHQDGPSSQFEIKRSGVATLFLESTLRRFLYPQHANRADKPALRIFYKPTLCFRPPHNLSTPLILIGPGTGVAPFISFLAQRYAQELDKRKQSHSGDCCGEGLWRGGFELEDLPSERGAVDKYIDSCVPGDVVLFFGCRNEDDFLFKQELALYEREHTLTRLYVAMSRQSEKKVYVMHKIAEQSDYLCDLIVQQHAQVYICGDGNKMAKDVIAALKDVLVQGGMERDGAEAYVTDMQQRKRLLLDIWSP